MVTRDYYKAAGPGTQVSEFLPLKFRSSNCTAASASGRKRPSKMLKSGGKSVRFAPESGRSANIEQKVR